MREILFRGKREDDGIWIFGYFTRTTMIDGSIEYLIHMRTNYFIVDPETIGQFTGIYDKTGMRIFEGDIISFRRFDNNHIGEIKFNRKTAAFEIWWDTTAGAYGEKATHTEKMSADNEYEVIDNIHDNPELLEAE